MTCKSTAPTIVSARELALRALEKTLRDIPMIRFVSRSDITAEQLAEPQLPAILIVERATQYKPQSTGPRQTVRVDSSIALDVQGVARRGCSFAEVSATREALVHAVLMQLYAHPGLRVMQSEDMLTVRVQPTLSAQVTYVQMQQPYARAMIHVDLVVEQQVDTRARTEGRTMIPDISVGA